MKLYRKKLNSVDELKRECIRLSYQKKQMDAKDLIPKLSFPGGSGSKEKGSKNAGILELGLGLINAKGPLQMALAVAGPLIGMIGKNKKKAVTAAPKRLLGNLVKEVVIGYVSGKGIQLAMRGARWYLKRRREKKAIARATTELEKTLARR